MRFIPPLTQVILAFLLGASVLTAQAPVVSVAAPLSVLAGAAVQQDRQSQEPVIEFIELPGAGDREAQIRAALSLRVGEVFKMENWERDVEFLWVRMRIRLTKIEIEELGAHRYRVIIHCVPLESFRRVVFLGHSESDISRSELLLATGLTGAQYIARLALPRIQGDIERAFRAEGFHSVEVTAEVREDQDEVAFHIEQGPKVRIGELNFIGNEAIPADKFIGTDLEGTAISGTGWLFFPGSVYIQGESERNDVVAIERLYHEYGYLEAKISADPPEFYSDNSRVKLTYRIEEGPLFTVGSVDVQAAVGGPDLQYPHQELLDLLLLKPGDPLEETRLKRDSGALNRFYGSKGHTVAGSSVSHDDSSFLQITVEKVLAENHQFNVVFRVQEGLPKVIGDVLIFGNRFTQDRVIRRDISLEPGDLADASEAALSHRRLLGSGYFLDEKSGQPYVDFRFLPTSDPRVVDLRFDVREGRGTGNILFGGGLSSNNGPFLSVNLQKTNFDITDTPSSLSKTFSEIMGGEAFTGGGQTLRLFLAPGSQYSTYRLSFYEPDLLREHISQLGLRMDLYKNFRFLRTHDEDRTGLGVTLSRRFGRYFSVFAGPRFERISLSSIEPGATPGIGLDSEYDLSKQSLIVGTQYSTINDRFSPVDSHKIRLELRQNGQFLGGDMDYIEADFSFGKYFGLFEDTLGRDWTLSMEGRMRKAWSDETIPYTERYWTGGTNSVRGFDFRGIGQTAERFAIGGEATVTGSLELRFPISSSRVREEIAEFQWVRGAVFVDAGTFGDDFGALDPLRVSAGFSLRIRLPMMPQFPISLDFGWPIASEADDDERVFQLNFGDF
jgi:outer membrane protein insertion porin family